MGIERLYNNLRNLLWSKFVGTTNKLENIMLNPWDENMYMKNSTEI